MNLQTRLRFQKETNMAKIRIEYDIEKCWECPLCKNKSTVTADSFEVAADYYCGVNNKKIIGYVEHDWEMPFVPNWCPLLVDAN